MALQRSPFPEGLTQGAAILCLQRFWKQAPAGGEGDQSGCLSPGLSVADQPRRTTFCAMIAAMLGKAFWAASGTGCQFSVLGRPLK